MAARESEAFGLIEESFENHGVFCIRYPRSRLVPSKEREQTPFGKWKKELSGHKTAVVSTGPITLELKELIKDKDVALYNALYLKPMDEEAIKELLQCYKVIIYDAYAVENGFCFALSEKLVSLGYKGEVVVKAIPDVFVEHASQVEQLEQFGLKPEQIAELL